MFSLGSVANSIQVRVDDIPLAISGAELIQMVDETRLYMEEYTGLSIGTADINDKFRPAMTNLCQGQLMDYMELVGGDSENIKLGDFSISKGADSNTSTAGAGFNALGKKQLASLGKDIRFRQVLG